MHGYANPDAIAFGTDRSPLDSTDEVKGEYLQVSQGDDMSVTEDDREWLANRWPYLRDTVRVVVTRHFAAIIAAAAEHGEIDEESWTAFQHAVARELMESRSRNPRLFDTALSFFGSSELLRQTIAAAGDALIGEQGPAVRMVVVKRGLTRMRDAWIGGSEHRGKTWGRLDAISREVERRSDRLLGVGGRCSLEHFEELLGHLRAHHSADRNLPRTIESIEEYFHDFCPDCRPVAMPEGFEPVALTLEADDAEGSEAVGAALQDCLDALPEEPRTFVLVHYKMTDPIEFSTAGYCQRNALDRRRFHRVLDRALEALRDCLDPKLSEGMIDAI